MLSQEWSGSSSPGILLGLIQLIQRLHTSLDNHEVLREAARGCVELIGATHGFACSLTDDGSLQSYAGFGEMPALDETLLATALHEGPLVRALATRRALAIADIQATQGSAPTPLPGRSLLVAPLLDHEQAIGVVALAHPEPVAFDDEQFALFSQASEAVSSALANARRYTALLETERYREYMSNLLVHDIRSPLMATYAGIEVVQRALRNQPLDEFVLDAMTSSLRTIRTVVDLTNDLLAMKKLQAGYTIDPTTVSLVDLFQRVVSLMRPIALQNEISLTTSVEPEALTVQADDRLLQRVVINLVANALRFARAKGQVTVSAGPAADGGVLIHVDDTGPGVPAGERERIFKPFVQGPGEVKRGTGLGLTFCREVVQSHRGRIWVEDAPGGGCRFTVALP